MHALGEAGIPVDDISLRRPTLDDVFLTLTGRTAEAAEAESKREGKEKDKDKDKADDEDKEKVK